jgi:hypothetical protein
VRERCVVGVLCIFASSRPTPRPPARASPTSTPSTQRDAGATRNFESWRQQDEAEEKFEGERKEAAEANAMSALESKTLDSKIEMDILDALDEIKVCVPASFVYRGDGVARLRVVASRHATLDVRTPLRHRRAPPRRPTTSATSASTARSSGPRRSPRTP